MEPIQDVEKVPKGRWGLVSLPFAFHVQTLTDRIRTATFAIKKWALAYNVATKLAIKLSMLHVPGVLDSS